MKLISLPLVETKLITRPKDFMERFLQESFFKKTEHSSSSILKICKKYLCTCRNLTLHRK